ncbi:hypothetical protein KAT08_04740 [Candidatus Babeliales bacterium]|nr:hypothetical protein [Candidatus Babeliales bacterium]
MKIKNNILLYFIFCIFFVLSFSLLADNDSLSEADYEKLVSILQEINQEEDGEFSQDFANLFDMSDGNLKDGLQEKEETYENKFDLKKSQYVFKKFNEYIERCFPKVFVIREKFFLNMTPEQIAKALEGVVKMLTFKPWLYLEHMFQQIEKVLSPKELEEWADLKYNINYLLNYAKKNNLDFVNFKKWLKSGGGFWEFIADQLSLYNNFIERCVVDLKDGVIFLEKDFCNDRFGFSFNEKKKNKKNEIRLKDYWEQKDIKSHHDLYALCFDYWGKLFLEAILIQDLRLAFRYYESLKKIMDKLRDTVYESERLEDIKRYKELLDILKRRECSDWNMESEDEDEDDKLFNEFFEFIDMD